VGPIIIIVIRCFNLDFVANAPCFKVILRLLRLSYVVLRIRSPLRINNSKNNSKNASKILHLRLFNKNVYWSLGVCHSKLFDVVITNEIFFVKVSHCNSSLIFEGKAGACRSGVLKKYQGILKNIRLGQKGFQGNPLQLIFVIDEEKQSF